MYTIFLKTLYLHISKKFALRIANNWGTLGLKNDKKYDAANWVNDHQQVYPVCDDCGWFILSREQSTNRKEHYSCLNRRLNQENTAWQESQMEQEAAMAAELYDEFDDEPEDDGCPHCGSHNCDTWACQQ